jgi:hypothetical protein
MPDRIIKGICTINFKNGATTQGDLSEYIFCENTEAVKNILTDPDFWQERGIGNYDVVNLSEVCFISVGDVKIKLPNE